MSLVIDSRKSLVVDKRSGIFAVAARSRAAAARDGAAAVINSTIGVGLDEAGRPFLIPTFVEELQTRLEQDPAKVCAYTPPLGVSGLGEAHGRSLLEGVELPDDVLMRALPTHGGTGGLALSILTSAGDTVLSHDPAWENYDLIVRQCGRRLAGFNLQRDDLSFDIDDFRRATTELAEAEGRLFLIVNSPYSNPPGSSIDDAEWQQMADVLAGMPVDKVLVLDLAYIDFGPSGKDPKDLAFLPRLFERVPDLNVILVPSLSKSMMAYGWRSGAAVLLTRDEAQADEWQAVMEGTIRGSNSNEVTAPQQAHAAILASASKSVAVKAERQAANAVIQSRFDTFRAAAESAGLRISKPTGGYFAVVYVDDALEVASRLEARNVFTVPLLKPAGLRISVCSLDLDRCARLPAEIASVL